MTLTHFLPTLRASLPNPIKRDALPEYTTTSVTDVVVAGVSLTHLADWCGTPCVHTAAAVIPGTDGMPSAIDLASAIVTRVVAVSVAPDGTVDVSIDAQLADSAIAITELRMIGRVSSARDARARIRTIGEPGLALPVQELVSDLRPGDLLTVPCRGTVRLRDIDPRRRHASREGDDDAPWPSAVCGR